MMRYVLCFMLVLLAMNLTASDVPDIPRWKSTSTPDSNSYSAFNTLRWNWEEQEKTYNFIDAAVVCTEVVYLDSLQTNALGYDRAYMTVICDTMFVLHHRR